ncbi:PfkB family carbohydrate kinase [Salinifilum ghardaiensis]
MPGERIAVLLVGLCTVDLVQRVEEYPRLGQKAQSTSVETAAGGPASHASVAVTALGGRATLLTGLGRHPLAALARDDLVEQGVALLDAAAERDEAPAVSAVTVRDSDGERTIVSHNAAGVDLPAPAETERTVAEADAVLIDGHHPQLAREAVHAAARRGVPVVADAGSYKPVFDELLPHIDLCACSEGFRLPDLPEQDDTDAALLDRGVGVLARTAGAGPVSWVHRTESGPERSGTVEPPSVSPQDTLAAGDVWHGALAHGVAELGRVPAGEEVPRLLDRANRVASVRVTRVGTRTWVEDVRGM